MNEDEAQRATADIALTLAASHVHGVFEERMPLDLEASLSIGCVTELVPAVRQKPLTEGFNIADLKVFTTAYQLFRLQLLYCNNMFGCACTDEG